MAAQFLGLEIYRPAIWRSVQNVSTPESRSHRIYRTFSRAHRFEIQFQVIGVEEDVAAAYAQIVAVWGGSSGVFALDAPQKIRWNGLAETSVIETPQYNRTARFESPLSPSQIPPVARYVQFANHAKIYMVQASARDRLSLFPAVVDAVPAGTAIRLGTDRVRFRGYMPDDPPEYSLLPVGGRAALSVTLREALEEPTQ